MVVKKILSINKESAVANFQPNSKQNGRCNNLKVGGSNPPPVFQPNSKQNGRCNSLLLIYVVSKKILSTQLEAKWSLQLRKLEEWLGLSSGVDFDKPRKNSPISFFITAETILSKA